MGTERGVMSFRALSFKSFRSFRTLLGITLVAVGAVLALFFRDLEFLWFRGGPLGLVLVLLGVLDLAESSIVSRRRNGARN
ncbi:hypothetical protein GCM10010145_43380 [Streptomyces ruber]|uniref:Uncharacterized protein n=2 Tax=Streptomyces TaxID=1883 RepID=A0A918EU79_9ACTN|nr:hypothetical protein GCM10010145_43380 [Streptomyces ruber]